MLETCAYAASSANAPLAPWVIGRREPGPHELLIDILFCGICHSDIHQARGDWEGSIFPMVPGHEIVGKVSQLGEHVSQWKCGDIVGVGCFVDSCRHCESCTSGEEQFCSAGMTPTYNGYEQDGRTPTYGGYSTRITVHESYVLRIPEGLALERAAPLLCAGITTYSPLRRWEVHPGDHVAVVGFGGLGHIATKISKAMGAHVTVLSHSPAKRTDAIACGADEFIGASDASVFRNISEGFDLMIDTLPVAHDYNIYLSLLRRDATMVLIGLPEPTPLDAASLVRRRRRLAGSLIGGIRETQEMLDFCARHQTTCEVEVIPIHEVNQAYERVMKADVRYRFVIDISSLRS